MVKDISSILLFIYFEKKIKQKICYFLIEIATIKKWSESQGPAYRTQKIIFQTFSTQKHFRDLNKLILILNQHLIS
jgi:hypothetical protein